MDLNAFTDWLPDEFMQYFSGHLIKPEPEISQKENLQKFKFNPIVNFSLPSSVDWRTVPNIVRPIKDQGICGSCWAFSAVSALESAYALTNKMLPDLSEQNLVDCVYANSYQDGCQGGWMTDAWSYIQFKGINSQSVYPYVSRSTGKVKYLVRKFS
jgi:C1A family cysteine protease